MTKWEQFRQFYSHFASFLKVCMPSVAEWTHSKVNPVDDPSFFQQQLVEITSLPRIMGSYFWGRTEWLLAWPGAYIDMVDSLYLRYKEPISSIQRAYIFDAKSLYRRCKKPLKRIVWATNSTQILRSRSQLWPCDHFVLSGSNINL